ncbi:MAG: PKD domain-containing protein [Flavobacteriales bacterium]|nr:PKD domain-containing protein [Flavobacteriales bacterium]
MRHLLPFVALLAALPAVAQPGPFLPGDLQYTLHVCTDTSYATLQGEAGPGEVADLDAINRGCLVGNELNGVWMHVQVATAGQLAFTLTPAVSGDLDFGVWGPFSAPVTALVAPPVRCSYAAGNGATGMNYTAMDLSEFAGGDRWVRYLDVLPGEWYMVYINQFSSMGLNFALTWDLQGGASLACLEAPVADFTGPVGPVLSGSLVDFTDISINHPYAWYWQFPTGVPATSLEPDPQGIVFTTPGCHPVQLTVYNAVGSSTTTVPCAVEVEVNTGVASVDPAAFVLRQEAGLLRVLPVDASRVAEVRVVDLRGRVVAITTGAGEQVVPLGNITPGVYAVEVVQDGIRTTRAVAFGH